MKSPGAADAKGQPSEFPVKIVGIGASAGGLEAFERFLRNIPADIGMAFVLIQHLDPNHDSMLNDILQRHTAMKVVIAGDDMAVVSNYVYVIPPNRDMTIVQGRLQLIVPKLPHGHRMPIDYFFRSLADDRSELAVGIVLSGTGADGTLGLRAIQGAGGITLVQTPEEAKFRGMPESAILNGYATHVMPVAKMGAFLATGPGAMPALNEVLASSSQQALQQILECVHSVTGNDFSEYKKSTIGRRVERRMQQHNIEDIVVYMRYLKANADEVKLLFSDLLINVTSFFRDPEAYDTLRREIIPALLMDKPKQYEVRIWVEACSTGEEAFSIAMIMREYMDVVNPGLKVVIFATDLDEHAIAVARAGQYPLSIVQDVLPERLERFFVKENGCYCINKVIREMVIFAVHNIVKDPPFTRLDLLSCRNLLIYFEQGLQNRLFPVFYMTLKAGGMLFLSPSESIGNHTELFTAVNRRWKFYRTTQKCSPTSIQQEPGVFMTTKKSANDKQQPPVKQPAIPLQAPRLPAATSPKKGKTAAMSEEMKQIEHLQSDLAYTKENLRATIEEQLSSNEELKSSNEELQSTNEELQSVNEEVVTVNAELHNKIEQLALMQNDMKNLFDNITIGIIFLDTKLAIRRYTPEATRIFPLVFSDVNRQLGDFKSTLLNETLLSDAQQVLDTLRTSENEVQTRDGRWLLARIQPYRTVDNVVEGVVMTFTDIDKMVQAHEQVLEARNLAEAIIDTVRQPLLVLDHAMCVVSASRSFYSEFRVCDADTLGRPIFDLGDRQWDIAELHRLLEIVMTENQSFDDFVIEHDFPVIGHRWLALNARRIVSTSGDTKLILLALENAGARS